MRLFRNTALVILIVIFLNIAASSIIEMNAINTSQHNLKVAANVASRYALKSFETTNFSGFDDDLGSIYNISDSHNKGEYYVYLDKIESQGNQLGFNVSSSDFQGIINFLKDDINSFNQFNSGDGVLSPFAFGWAFLEGKRLEKEFDFCLSNIVDANYGSHSDNVKALVFSGTDVLRIKSAKAEIVKGPTLVDLTEGLNPNSSLYRTYLKLFGSTKSNAADMVNGINAFKLMFNYIITYDVKFTVEWEHHTTTPFFSTFGRVLPQQFINERDQLKMEMQPLVIERKYAVIN